MIQEKDVQVPVRDGVKIGVRIYRPEAGGGTLYVCLAECVGETSAPPHLACLAPYDGMNDPYRYLAFRGGIESNFPLYWFNASVRVPNLYPANGDHPRILEKDFYLEVQHHPNYDEYWKERAAAENLERIEVPVFSIGVWAKMELHLAGNILGYHKVSGPKKLFITGTATAVTSQRSEERRVGKEGRSRWSPYH